MNNDVFVVGNHFLEVDGVACLYAKTYKGVAVNSYYSIDSSFECAQRNSYAKIILIAEPHVISYTLYNLKRQYPNIDVIVVANNFYYSDFVILKTVGIKLNMTFTEFIQQSLDSRLTPFFYTADTDSIQYLPPLEKFECIKFINNEITCQLQEYGVTQKQTDILLRLYNGISPHLIACELKISEKTVCTHKTNALMKLPMGRSRWALTKGLWISLAECSGSVIQDISKSC